MRSLLSLALAMLTVAVSAQTILTGTVRTPDGRGVDYASVTAAPADAPRNFLASAFTDESGRFRLAVAYDCDSIVLRVTSIDIAPAVLTVPNRSADHLITATESTIELQEVIVKAKKIYSRGDTVNYSVAAFIDANDRALADVLRRMPGISVAGSGQISYQGKPIKNFYIEGMDLMKSHYGIATNNLDPNDIATVQVLESHQDIKALQGLRPEEQASINIRLKEGVKGVFTLIATPGGGYGDGALWNNSAMATFFRRNSQFLATYKGNNTGDDLSQELYTSDKDYSRTSEIAAAAMPAAPGLDKRLYYRNRSHSATFNNVYRAGHSGELGINAAYLTDRDSRSSNSLTANTLPDGSMNVVDEAMDGLARSQKAYGDLTYMLNGDSLYLKEQLKFDWHASASHSLIRADGDDEIAQRGSSHAYRLINHLHLTRRRGQYSGFEVSSTLALEKRPHSLAVVPNLFGGLIAGEALCQSVSLHHFSAENRAGLLSV